MNDLDMKYQKKNIHWLTLSPAREIFARWFCHQIIWINEQVIIIVSERLNLRHRI